MLLLAHRNRWSRTGEGVSPSSPENERGTNQSTDYKWYTEPCAVLNESKDVSAAEESEDCTSDGTTGDGWRVRPEDVCFLRRVRHS